MMGYVQENHHYGVLVVYVTGSLNLARLILGLCACVELILRRVMVKERTL